MKRIVKLPKGMVVAGITLTMLILMATWVSAESLANFSGVANLNRARAGHTATLLDNGKILIVGGADRYVPVADSEIFDPSSQTFSPGPASIVARADHAAIKLADGRVLIMGGRNQDIVLASTEIFDPANGSFSAGPSMTMPRYGHTATALGNGKILIVGGDAGGTAEIYDLATNTFLPVESPCFPRAFHSTVLLQSGKVLITGGIGPDNAMITRAEIFDPQTNYFSNVMSGMSIARLLPLLRVLPDGKVQVIGGDAENTMEVYDPSEGAFKGLVHLPPSLDLLPDTLSTQSRSALIDGNITQNPRLTGVLSDPLYKLLMDRSDYSLTEIPRSNKALVAGGVCSASLNDEALNSAMMVQSSPASISTDKTDYAPGETVTIAGQRWLPGETVSIIVNEEPEAYINEPVLATADMNGSFTNQDFYPFSSDIGRTFTATATGQSSGWTAQTSFADAAALTVAPSSQQTFWLDDNKCNAQGPRAAWLSFIIKNTGTTAATNVTVTFAGFTGTNASHFCAGPFSGSSSPFTCTPTDLTRTFSTIAAGAQEPVYFYVDYSEVCNHNQGGGNPYSGYVANYTVTASATGVTPVVYNGTVATDGLLTASAAGVAANTTLGPGFWVGQLLAQTVTYNFGNNSDLFFQPAGDAGFDAACIRLVGSEITNVDGTVSTSLIGLKDQLWFPTASVSGGGGNIYMTYTWQILCVNRSQTLHPWASAKSGSKYKYSGFQYSTVFPASVPALTASKTVSPASLTDNTGGPVTWTVTFTNPTAVPLVLSKITDVLPSCMSINDPAATGSQVTAANSSSIPAVGATGTVSWVGIDLGDSPGSTYQVPAGGTLTLKYKTNVSGCSYPASYTNSATGTVGTTTVGPVTATLSIGAQPGITLAKSASPTTYNSVGQTITYTYTITNSGNVPLPGLFSVSDDKLGTLVDCASGPLAEAASTTCTATHTITQADLDAGSINNTATATTTYNSQTVTSSPSTATVTAAQTKALTLSKSAGPTTYGSAGQTITYTYTIKNTGNVTLTGPFSVSDDKATVTCTQPGDGALSPNETMTCGATYTITAADLSAGSVTNTASATGGGVTSPIATATVTAIVTETPHLTLTKTVTETSFNAAGVTLHYNLVATNDGNATLSGVSISDPKLGALTCSPSQPATLAPAATLSCTGTYVTTQADVDAGEVDNTASAGGMFGSTPVSAEPASATVTATQTPHLTLTKSASPSSYSKVGDVINYTLVATNDGNVTLSGVSISDATLGALTCTPSQPATLAPAATLSCTGSYTIKQSDLDAGKVTNSATGSGSGPLGQPVSDTESATVNAIPNPHLSLNKSGTLNMTLVSPVDRADAGDRIDYTLTATNDGNITLTGVTIADSMLGALTCTPAQPATLASGASLICTGSYVLTQTDINAGKVDNTAAANSDQTGEVTTTTDVPLPSSPGLMLTKSASPADYDTVGETITHHFQIKNTGNVTMTGPFQVTDDKQLTVDGNTVAANTLFTCGTGPLDPGASTSCDATYTITQDDLDQGSVTNTASASTIYNGQPINSGPSTVTINAIQNPELTVKKSSTTTTVTAADQVVPYSYLIENTGNVTVTGISVTDNHVASVSCLQTSLPPSGSMTCTGSHTVTQAEIDTGGSLTNTVSVTSSNAPTATDTLNIPVSQNPHLTLSKLASRSSYSKVGDVINYSLVAKNDGNVTLSNVTISDPTLGTLTCTQPVSLAPGATLTCTGSHTVTQADLDAGSYKNTATASGSNPAGGTTGGGPTSVTVPAVQNPALYLAKTANKTVVSIGDNITYTYTITNSGNVTLAGPFTVNDNKLGTVACGGGSLVPTATTSCTVAYTTTQSDIGGITNTATASTTFNSKSVTSNQASATVKVFEKGVITDTMLCTLPNSQFKLVFTPDQNANGSWKLNASNPGQFYYNIFYVGAGNEDITITLPYAWVTQGAVPVHVYSDVGVTMNSSGGYCLTPTGELANEPDQVTLANYSPQTFGSTTTVTIHVPAVSGFAYINLHLDYGLKGTTGYAKGGPSGNDAVKSGTSTVLIPDIQSYGFSDTEGGSVSAMSINSFKKDPGIGGLVLNTNGDAVKNAKVQIYQGTSKSATATVYTDEDGWYMWQYKWTGKAVSFVIKMTPSLPYKQTTQSQTVMLKANGYLVVNFTVPLP